MKEPKLASIICEDLRDAAINHYLDIESGWLKSPEGRMFHERLKEVPEEHRALFRAILTASIDVGMHDFLFRMSELHDQGQDVGWYENGTNVASDSDGLHGEPWGDSGWIAAHSQHAPKPNGEQDAGGKGD